MAVLVRTRRLSNPGIKKLRRRGTTVTSPQWYYKRSQSKKRAGERTKNPAKKRLSLAQKLHFGTARQRAAARLSLKGRRKKNSGAYSIRTIKKHFKKRAESESEKKNYTSGKLRAYYGTAGTKRKNNRKKNVGEIVSISLAGLANPGRKRRKNIVAKSRKRRLAGLKAARTRKRRRSNPGTVVRRRRTRRSYSHARPVRRRRRNSGVVIRRINAGRRRGRRSNPGIGGVTSGVIGKAFAVIGGAIGSKYITQLALGGNNTGYMGYAGNLVAAIGLGWAAGKVTKSKDIATSVMIGGIAGLALRMLQDMTSIGQYVNLSLAGVGKGGDLGLGIIQDSSFPVPQTFAPGSMTNAIVPRATRMAISSAQQAQAASMAAAGSKGIGRMMGGRARRGIM